MTNNELIIIMPFRLKYMRFTFDNIKNLQWDLWYTYRTGDYRKLNITTSSGYKTNISDLEFINYNSLEKWLIQKTNIELNLERKLNVELRQAKSNRWLNAVIIVMFVFFFFLFSIGIRQNNISIFIRIAMVVITWRLVVRLVQYQQLINAVGQRRKQKRPQPK